MEFALPNFEPDDDAEQMIRDEIATAKFIRSLWSVATASQKSDPQFLSLLVCCGWVNVSRSGGIETTREWRNRIIAGYLGVDYTSDQQLAETLQSAFPRLGRARTLLASNTGITHYYRPFRPAALDFVVRHSETIARIFKIVSSEEDDKKRIETSITELGRLGNIKVRMRGRSVLVQPSNGLTPTLACLDRRMRLPILNSRTDKLLHVIGGRRDAEGAIALYKLIGTRGIKNSFELDVYSQKAKFAAHRPRALTKVTQDKIFRDVGLKSETNSLGRIGKSTVKIRKLHNELINRFRDAILWQYPLKEDRFDALVPEYKPGRHLLIEEKTSSDGSDGRTQVRLAIGQLFDYRESFFPGKKIDLALLVPKKPGDEVFHLLSSLEIGIIWFERQKLKSNIGFPS